MKGWREQKTIVFIAVQRRVSASAVLHTLPFGCLAEGKIHVPQPHPGSLKEMKLHHFHPSWFQRRWSCITFTPTDFQAQSGCIPGPRDADYQQCKPLSRPSWLGTFGWTCASEVMPAPASLQSASPSSAGQWLSCMAHGAQQQQSHNFLFLPSADWNPRQESLERGKCCLHTRSWRGSNFGRCKALRDVCKGESRSIWWKALTQAAREAIDEWPVSHSTGTESGRPCCTGSSSAGEGSLLPRCTKTVRPNPVLLSLQCPRLQPGGDWTGWRENLSAGAMIMFGKIWATALV